MALLTEGRQVPEALRERFYEALKEASKLDVRLAGAGARAFRAMVDVHGGPGASSVPEDLCWRLPVMLRRGGPVHSAAAAAWRRQVLDASAPSPDAYETRRPGFLPNLQYHDSGA